MKQIASITDKFNEIVNRIADDSIDARTVEFSLEVLADSEQSKLSWNPPDWWRLPEHQLYHARKLWPELELPEPPVDFTPQTETEVLLLHTPGSVRSIYDSIETDIRIKSLHKGSLLFDGSGLLRSTRNKREFTEPTWLGFDPEYGKGENPLNFWNLPKSCLASSEVFSALIQFPEWPSTWTNDIPGIYMAGYEFVNGWMMSYAVPQLQLDTNHNLSIGYVRLDESFKPTLPSPSIRKLN